MAKYEVRLTTSVQRTLRKLPGSVADSLEEATLALETEPRPTGCKKLRGRDAYRI